MNFPPKDAAGAARQGARRWSRAAPVAIRGRSRSASRCFRWWHPRRDGGADYELIWGTVLFVLLAAARLLPARLFTWYRCPFRHVTGLPCPTCGVTRATLHAVRSDWLGALELNPLGAIGLGLSMLYVGYAAVVVMGRLPRLRPSFRHPFCVFFFRVVVPAALVANWIYLITQGV